MIVNKSMVDFNSTTVKKTSYEKTNETLMKNVLSNDKRYMMNSFKVSYEEAVNEKSHSEYDRAFEDELEKEKHNEDKLSERVKGDSEGGRNMSDRYIPGSLISPIASVQERNSLQNLLSQLRAYLYNFRQSILDFLGMGHGMSRTGDGTLYLDISGGSGGSLWNRINYVSETYTESESMEFQTTGKVVTADGRKIDFNLSVEMSREFTESCEALTQDTVAIFTDPLIINLDSNPISVSDQKWSFDIDGDGDKDSISLLSKGNGFLAFDRDGNGRIDDGSELFGTKSGNGFKDLSEYDQDGNGWIDEADDIYEKLSVWLKDDSGQDRLISLKEANVGAIYLGSAKSDYAMKSDVDNHYNAQLRRTGVFLTENGLANTIAQLDFVVEAGNYKYA